jgi:Winged helix DNA-binding domain
MSWDQALAWRMKRHHLVGRAAPSDLVRVVGEICGLHAQLMSSAELSLWARIDGLERDAVHAALWMQRALVKLWAMRGTLHLLPAAELGVWLSAPAPTHTTETPGQRQTRWPRQSAARSTVVC